MKKVLLFICLFINASIIISQTTNSNEDVLTIVEQMPIFPGGEKAMKEYLLKNIQYPRIEKEFRISGMVFMTFVVQKDGSILGIRCLKPIKGAPALNKEAIRVITAMPKWKPGVQNKKAVNVQYVLPIKFFLENNDPFTDEEILAIANNHYKKGIAFAEEKKYKDALEEFDYTIFCLPSDINTLYQRGIAFHNLKKDKEACDEWNKVKFLENNIADEMLKKYCK